MTVFITRSINNMVDIVQLLHKENGIKIANDNFEECVDVRRDYFLKDAFRECKKKKFDPKKISR